jgi:biopolymer transport protein ExbB
VTDWNLLQGSGPLIWPLFALGVLSLAFFLERILYLHKIQIHAEEFLEGIKNALRQNRLVEALTLCEESKTPVANLIKAALLNHDEDEKKLRGAIQTVGHLELPLLEKRFMALGVVAKVAPMLGLLGTLLAGSEAFHRLQQAGFYANSADFAGDLTHAVMSTVIGFVIAITSQCGKAFLCSRVNSIVHDLEWAANGILQFLLHDLPGKTSGINEEEGNG